MAGNKTVETEVSVSEFLGQVPDPAQRRDAETIIEIMERTSGHPPRMWGPSIVGFGRYRYKYESGREGEMCRIGLSPRKGNTVVYIVDGYPGREAILDRLGKHKLGKACLYIKRLSDIDLDVLEELITTSLSAMQAKYPE